MPGRRKRKPNSRSGFTLAEVIIASMLFFVISGGFITAYLSAMRTHMVANDFYRATCIARNRIQRAWTLDFDSLPLLGEMETPVDELGNIDTAGSFRRTTSVSNTVPNCTRVTVQVRYPVPNGKLSPATVDVHTMIARGI